MRDIGQVAVIDDHEQIEIRLIAILRLVDPIIARIAAEQDDLQDLAVLARRRGRLGDGLGKLVHQHALHAFQFAPLRRGQMIDILSHREDSVRADGYWQA